MSSQPHPTQPNPARDELHAQANGEHAADDPTLAAIRDAREAWKRGPVAKAVAKMPPRMERFTTLSDLELPDVVTPADVNTDYLRDLGLPGEYPFTRGI